VSLIKLQTFVDVKFTFEVFMKYHLRYLVVKQLLCYGMIQLEKEFKWWTSIQFLVNKNKDVSSRRIF